MIKILPSRFRYPLFFLGLLIMELSGLLLKFANLAFSGVEVMIAAGFLVFVFSIVAT
ncbi:MAG: hypothetical protein QW597_00330 [Thermoplasmataceae archaeon]